MLLNFAVNNPIRNQANPGLLACSLSADDTLTSAKEAADTKLYTAKDVELEVASRGDAASQYIPHAEAAAKLVKSQFDNAGGINTTIAFGYSNGVALGAYIGSAIASDNGILASFLGKLSKRELSTSGSMMQVCDASRSSAYTVGVVSEANSNNKEALSVVQETLAAWNRGECVQGYKNSRKSKITVGEVVRPSGNSSHISSHAKAHAKKSHSGLHSRADCRTIQLTTEHSCTELAATCGISPADFTKYNPSSTLCGNLQKGQHVCCSAGTRPNFAPSPNQDGTCATYKINNGDLCSQIAAAHDVTVDNISDWNKKTWGWQGCGNLPLNGKLQFLSSKH
jgi:hypothetical protein